MMNRPLMMSIAAVERDTGLSKDTLRVWERRYGFPVPVRDGQGERCYPLDQIERLRVIKRLLDVGHRPGRVVELPMDDLMSLAERSADAQGLGLKVARKRAAPAGNGQAAPATEGRSPLADDLDWPDGLPGQRAAFGAPPDWPESSADPAASPWVAACLERVDAHDPIGLRQRLNHALTTLGLATFITDVTAPLLRAMGEGWLRGRFQVTQEHWVSHQLKHALHTAIHRLPVPAPGQAPRVLLSTFPGEPHGMGLLMVEGWLTMLQAQPLNLGPQTPLWDLVQASQQHQVDVVAIGFTANSPSTMVLDTLADLRAKLPPQVAVWAGGQHPLLQRRPPDGVKVIDSMTGLSEAVQAWRRQAGRPGQDRA